MKALAYLLGSRALDTAAERGASTPTPPEGDLLPFASTPEQAAAWRRWAKEGREAIQDGGIPSRVAPADAPRALRRTVHGGDAA
jgi:hypothetical protein